MIKSSAATVEPRKHAKDQRQAALVEAANAVFAEKGYDAATTREIAERACVSEGLIHRYFGGKRGLLTAILRRKSESMHGVLGAGVPDQDSLHDEIRALFLWSLDFLWAQRDFVRVLATQAILDRSIGLLMGSEINAGRVRLIREKLERHRAAGRIRDGVDLEVVSQLISGLAFDSGFFMQVVFSTDREELRQMVREVVHIIVRGIEADAQGCADERDRNGPC
jgi:AcrR family transcriptional regulator